MNSVLCTNKQKVEVLVCLIIHVEERRKHSWFLFFLALGTKSEVPLSSEKIARLKVLGSPMDMEGVAQ